MRALAILFLVAAPTVARAQSDILLELRSGSPLTVRGRFDSGGGLVLKGVLGVGIIPFTGAGERLVWHPNKAAFRAGSIGAAGSQWDDPNIGYYSWAGGYNTTALGLASFAMGYQSTALSNYSTALGFSANAAGTGAVAIGYRTTADADYSVAIGQRASANGRTGAIVLSDASTTDSTQASANNQFTVRAAGGYRFFTNATMNAGVQMAAGGSSFTVISDRNRKANFMELNGEDILQRLRGVPVSSWQYKDEEDRSTRHIGPMAQDFHAAFGLTTDDRTINMSDLDGVNLAAVQALEARTRELRTTQDVLASRTARLEAVEKELAELRVETTARFVRLEAAIARSQSSPPK